MVTNVIKNSQPDLDVLFFQLGRNITALKLLEKDQEIKDLRDKLSRASLASQVNEYDFLKVEFTQCAQNDFFCVKMR